MDSNIQHEDLNTLIKRRLEELDELKKKNIEPFEYSFDVDSYSQEIKDSYQEGIEKNVKIAGRIMAIRRMGKASFAHLQDRYGKIQ
ncbi:MAG: OB-fold nucleic acid binding domain-containing protein, partial [Bacillota bacterium]